MKIISNIAMRLCALFLMAFGASAACGQSVEMLSGSPQWENHTFYYDAERDFIAHNQSFNYWISGEMEAGGKTYYMLHCEVAHPDAKPHGKAEEGGIGIIVLGLREEGGRVYVSRDEYVKLLENGLTSELLNGDKDYLPYEVTEDGEMVLYDFTMGVGDGFAAVQGHDAVTVSEVGERDMGDGIRRRLQVLSNGLELVEGIGCVNSVGGLLFYLNAIAGTSFPFPEYGVLRYYTHTGDEWYYSLDIDEYVRGLQLGMADVRFDKCMAPDAPCYDLSGRRISGTPRSGLYIKGGRKIVVK